MTTAAETGSCTFLENMKRCLSPGSFPPSNVILRSFCSLLLFPVELCLRALLSHNSLAAMVPNASLRREDLFRAFFLQA